MPYTCELIMLDRDTCGLPAEACPHCSKPHYFCSQCFPEHNKIHQPKAIPSVSPGGRTKKKPNAITILNILLDGHAVVVDGEEYRYQDGVFGVRRESWKDEIRQDDIVIGIEMTVDGFIKWCEKMPEETMTRVVFAHVVQLQRESQT